MALPPKKKPRTRTLPIVPALSLACELGVVVSGGADAVASPTHQALFQAVERHFLLQLRSGLAAAVRAAHEAPAHDRIPVS